MMAWRTSKEWIAPQKILFLIRYAKLVYNTAANVHSKLTCSNQRHIGGRIGGYDGLEDCNPLLTLKRLRKNSHIRARNSREVGQHFQQQWIKKWTAPLDSFPMPMGATTWYPSTDSATTTFAP